MPRPELALIAILAAAAVSPAAFAGVAGGFTNLEHVARVPFSGGTDLTFHGDYAFVAAPDTRIIDISDPENPVLVASVACSGKDIGVLATGGRVVLTVSSQSGDGCPGASSRGGIRLVDVTDPANPIVGPQVELAYGSHTNSPVGNTGLVYNSAYNLFNPLAHHRAEIVDVTDFTNPRVVREFAFPATSTSGGCHDILVELDRARAYCAALTETQVWDVSDPLDPVITATILNPAITIHHSAATIKGGDVLVIGDEWAGAIPPGGCAHRGLAPQGALWFYDVTLPQPVPLGYWAPPATTVGLCTAHNFNAVDGTDYLVGSAYQGGTFLVDATNPTLPATVDLEALPSATTWSAYAYRGYAFTGDLSRGLDAFRIE